MSDRPTPETDAVERGLADNPRRDPQLRLAIHARYMERQRDEAREILAATLKALPVGYLPSHTPESIPERVADLVARYAEADRQRDAYAETMRETLAMDPCADNGDILNTIRNRHPELSP